MNIEELIAGLKEKGLDEEQVKAELEKIRKDIDAYLEPDENPAEKNDEVHEEVKEDEAEKQKRVFGI